MKESFSNRLTPGQVQQILDALGLPWREHNVNHEGWVDIPHDSLNSDLGVNIHHGGYVDHYMSGDPDGKGDLVALVAMHITGCYFRPDLGEEDFKNAIQQIKEVCGINNGVRPPDIPKGFRFAMNYSEIGNGKFARIPKDILRSKLKPSEKLVWSAIFDRCGVNEIYSFPGLRRIKSDTGLSLGAVQNAIEGLSRYGLLIEKPRGNSSNTAPARFPLVAPADAINQKIRELKRKVSKNEHPCSYYELWHTIYRTKLDQATRSNQRDPYSIGAKPHNVAIAHTLFPFSEDLLKSIFIQFKNNSQVYDHVQQGNLSAGALLQ